MVHKYEVVKNLVHHSDFGFVSSLLEHWPPSWLIILETDEYLEKLFITNLAAYF